MRRRRPGRPGQRRRLQPLRRRPKELTEAPTLHLSSGGTGSVLGATGRPDPALPGSRTGDAAPGFTEESGAGAPGPDRLTADEEVRRRARQLARRLALSLPSGSQRRRAATGSLVTRRWRGGATDLDLDATLESVAATPLPADEDFFVRERVRRRRAVVLVVDISGSARGEQVRTAAATVGALAGELHRDAVAVVAFWSEAAVLTELGAPLSPDRIIDSLLSLPARGLTNVEFALQTAADRLRGVPESDARVLLLSDCVHNAGPDPRNVVPRLPRLDVLLDVSGEHDAELGRDLALLGRGRCLPVRGYRDVVPGLRRVFEP